jgi:hypothetical protein
MALRVALRGAFRLNPTLLLLEPEELRRKALPIGEGGPKVLCEVADLARQDLLALCIQHLGGLDPGRYQGPAFTDRVTDLSQPKSYVRAAKASSR